MTLAELDYTYHIDADFPDTEAWMFDAETLALLNEYENITKE